MNILVSCRIIKERSCLLYKSFFVCGQGLTDIFLWAKRLTDILCTNYYNMKELEDTI